MTIAGGVKCWGWDGDGQLGLGRLVWSAVPVDVIGLESGPIYTISGQVRDNSNNPIPGVIVSAGSGRNTTTNASGVYAITGLITGTYTLTPTKSVYTFSPASRTVSVPPDAAGQDFTGTLSTYSISGQVRDASNNPISGVLISDGAGHTATTNSSGNYTLSGLVPGAYTLTPSKSGYTFSPPTRMVNVPPDATGQDFVRVPTGPMPIVMVHGFRGLGLNMFTGFFCPPDYQTKRATPDEADHYFNSLDDKLAEYRPVFYARLVSSQCYTASLEDNVPYLVQAIDEAQEATGHSKVILVTHSMGGLVSRAYIESSQYRDDVEALFTLGSPHHGVPHDLLTFTANGFTALGDLIFDWGTFCEDRQPGMCDFSILGMAIFNDDHALNQDVKYYFLTGDAPTFSRNPIGLATDVLFLLQPNDGIVGLNSGIGGALTVNPNVQFNRHTNDENHNIFGIGALYDWPYFGPRWDLLTSTDSKTYTECLKPVLVDGAQTTCPAQRAR